jgi:hypothetical protein
MASPENNAVDNKIEAMQIELDPKEDPIKFWSAKLASGKAMIVDHTFRKRKRKMGKVWAYFGDIIDEPKVPVSFSGFSFGETKKTNSNLSALILKFLFLFS